MSSLPTTHAEEDVYDFTPPTTPQTAMTVPSESSATDTTSRLRIKVERNK